jgi:hypothetical protein
VNWARSRLALFTVFTRILMHAHTSRERFTSGGAGSQHHREEHAESRGVFGLSLGLVDVDGHDGSVVLSEVILGCGSVEAADQCPHAVAEDASRLDPLAASAFSTPM